jgi:hypothetical protein
VDVTAASSMMLRPARLLAMPSLDFPIEDATHRHQALSRGTCLAIACSQGVTDLPVSLIGCRYSLGLGVYFTFFLTKISEIYKGSPYTGGTWPPKQGHGPVPIN